MKTLLAFRTLGTLLSLQLVISALPLAAGHNEGNDKCALTHDAGDSRFEATVLSHSNHDCGGVLTEGDVDWYKIKIPTSEPFPEVTSERIEAWACTKHGGLFLNVKFYDLVSDKAPELGWYPVYPLSKSGSSNAGGCTDPIIVSADVIAAAGGAWYIGLRRIPWVEGAAFDYDLHIRFSS